MVDAGCEQDAESDAEHSGSIVFTTPSHRRNESPMPPRTRATRKTTKSSRSPREQITSAEESRGEEGDEEVVAASQGRSGDWTHRSPACCCLPRRSGSTQDGRGLLGHKPKPTAPPRKRSRARIYALWLARRSTRQGGAPSPFGGACRAGLRNGRCACDALKRRELRQLRAPEDGGHCIAREPPGMMARNRSIIGLTCSGTSSCRKWPAPTV